VRLYIPRVNWAIFSIFGEDLFTDVCEVEFPARNSSFFDE
jgi:hypothetical protein